MKNMIKAILAALAVVTIPQSALAQTEQPATQAVSPEVARAQALIADDYDNIIAELIAITEIPAPPFAESERASFYAESFRTLGLTDVTVDEIGNVLGLRRGTGPADGKLLVVSAHLDTVFPANTDVTVRREGDRLHAPGIGDDSLGLATLLAWVRAMDGAQIATTRDILFVGTVGEEGLGDLRGVRHLMTQGRYKDRIGAFVSVDGSNPARIVHQSVGSKRYRISFKGPGGHSYGAFGIVNPIAAMADTVSRLYATQVPGEPRTTYSASVVSGGTSVNSIPAQIDLEVDMRSPDPEQLARLETRFLAIVDAAVETENFARSTTQGAIAVDKQPIGDRPAGVTAPDHPLVMAAREAFGRAGFTVNLAASSTDSNVAMSMGIPAVTIGSGADGGRAHSLDEYLDIEREAFVRGVGAGLDFVVAAAGLEY